MVYTQLFMGLSPITSCLVQNNSGATGMMLLCFYSMWMPPVVEDVLA